MLAAWAVVAVAVEVDLFGNEVEIPEPVGSGRPPVNDMDLIEHVLALATGEGLVLAGPREEVFCRVGKDGVEPVSPAVDHAVHQLIEIKWLEVGGHHLVWYLGDSWSVRSVLVPRKIKARAYRWSSLQKLPGKKAA